MTSNKLNNILLILFVSLSYMLKAQTNPKKSLSLKEQHIVAIAASTSKGDLAMLKTELETGLDAGLTVNQIKELIVHIYAYAGFPRSIRGLQTFMAVLDERKAKGITYPPGAEASSIDNSESKYARGRTILQQLTGVPEMGTKAGYAAFAPIIEVFLKEHLFADIFERDILSYTERELVTISVLASIGGVEPMLQSHLKICLNVGLTAEQLQQFVTIIKSKTGEDDAIVAGNVLDEVLKTTK